MAGLDGEAKAFNKLLPSPHPQGHWSIVCQTVRQEPIQHHWMK